MLRGEPEMNRIVSNVGLIACSAALFVVGVNVAYSEETQVSDEVCEAYETAITSVDEIYGSSCVGDFSDDSPENAAKRAEFCGRLEITLNDLNCEDETEGCCG